MAIISLSVPLLAASLVFLLLYIWSSSTAVISGNINKCDSTCFNNLQTQPNDSDIPVVSQVNKSDIPWHGNNSWSWVNPYLRAKEIERQMKVHRSWQSSSISNSTSSCEGRGIYVYELPTKFNKDLMADECGAMMTWLDFCKYLSNGGLGEAVAAEELGPGWHNTNQFTLEPIFHARVLNHRCRVAEWRDARLFYVPFYAGLDLTRRDLTRDPNNVKDSLALELLSWLGRQEAWRRNSGWDHVFVLGKMTWEFRRQEGQTWGSNFQELPQMQNPIKLLIERQPWEINDVGVPYPTFFHPRTDEDIINWQRKVSGYSRASVVGFAGAARPELEENIRSILIEQCTSASHAECKFLDCSKERCFEAETIVGFFMESEFCLQPPGDSATRKSFFDSLISGCIPVVFDIFTAYYQYPWHLPQDWTKYSVFVDENQVRNKTVNVVQTLTKIPPKIRDDMRRYIIYHLLPRLLYGDPHSDFHLFQDAFSTTVNALFGRITTFNTS